MVFPLGPGQIKVEFMPDQVAATWVDVSSKIILSRGVKIQPAQPTEILADVEAGNAVIPIYCDDGVWWPDNPSSPYFGKVIEGMPCRVTGTIGSSTTVRHLGRVRLIEPELIGSVAKGAACTFTSTDVLADLGGLTLLDRLSENLRFWVRTGVATYTNGNDAWDSWPLTDDVASGMVASARHAGNDGTIIYPRSRAGTVTFEAMNGSADGGPLSLPNMATFEPVNGIGPVLKLPVTAATAGQVYLAARSTTGQAMTIAEGWDGSGNRLWAIKQVLNGSAYDINILDSTNTVISTLDSQHANDGAWHTFVLFIPGTGLPNTFTSFAGWAGDDPPGAFTITIDPSQLRWIIAGGSMNPNAPGKQSGCYTGDISMLGVAGATGIANVENECSIFAKSCTSAFSEIVSRFGKDFSTLASWTTVVTAMQVANFATQGLNALDAIQTIARSVGGQIVVEPQSSGVVSKVNLFLPEKPAPNLAPAFTVNLSNDDTGALPLQRGADLAPTRATTSSPLAAATFVGDESTRRQDGSIDTFNVNPTDAFAVAGGWVNRPRSSRITPIAIDLATAIGGQTLANAVMAMQPMVTTFTLGSMPSELFGVTTQDQIVLGWQEVWADKSLTVEISCLPAADWAQNVFDATSFGRFGANGCLTVTNGNSLGTGTGALTVASSTGDLMLTGTALPWNWNGECVSATASGASSPQTLTISARGQNGTIARTHADGEPIDTWQPATFGY